MQNMSYRQHAEHVLSAACRTCLIDGTQNMSYRRHAELALRCANLQNEQPILPIVACLDRRHYWQLAAEYVGDEINAY